MYKDKNTNCIKLYLASKLSYMVIATLLYYCNLMDSKTKIHHANVLLSMRLIEYIAEAHSKKKF